MRIQENVLYEYEIERSVFICYLERCFTVEDARNRINEIRKEHPDATHHCTAFICENTARSNDDGEPAGTAGMPMLEVLRKRNLEDVLAVVVRYFGGIKLGAGGLIRAYSGTVSDAIKEAVLTEVQPRMEYTLTFSYDYIGKLEYALKDTVTITDKQYDQQVTFTYLCAEPVDALIQEITSGKFHPVYVRTIQVESVVK